MNGVSSYSSYLKGGQVAYLQAFVLVALYGFIYAPLVPPLVKEWYEHENFSYGFAIPFIFLYLLWSKKETLRNLRASPDLWGGVFLLAAVFLGLVGNTIGDVFTVRLSMIFTLVTAVHLFLGRDYFRALLFPLAYLCLMVPPPYVIVKEVSDYLRAFDASIATHIVQALGIPIYQDAHFLHLPEMTLEVADVCSGIASLFAMLALSFVYVFFLPIRWTQKAVVIVGALVFPVLANLFRIVLVTVSVYYYGPIMLRAFFHNFTGTFTFIVSLAMLLALGESLRRKSCRDTSKQPVGRTKLESSKIDGQIAIHSFMPPFLISLIILSLALYGSRALAIGSHVPVRSDLEELPAAVGPYVLFQKDWQDPYQDSHAEIALSRVYEVPGEDPVEIYVGYRGEQRQDRLSSQKIRFPAPKWNSVWIRPERLVLPGIAPINANWILAQKGELKRLILYWYQVRGRSIEGEIQHRLFQVSGLLAEGRTDGAVIRFATSLKDQNELSQAQGRIRQLVLYSYPEIIKSLPQ